MPGRFFSAVTPEVDRVAVVAYDRAGSELARVGTLSPPAHPPRSRADAIRQGDPAGFAPTAPTPDTFIYEGREISEAEAMRLELACLQGARAFRCFDREGE